ncbi:lipid IV(A) 3-deoxy-D-manno-octulosonic acid transferase [Arhodomonas aquaeolei]|uniref:lipid IV(A) 3-deoxy-D-manno-octulosonic acid transferase n=1 Tax=Arhodomonas aquaeolei TaxID=2369 RepID=UPI002169E26F|nr:lipid IV(A) 3-deoxy-D-manno-octulosonic acid transferase [Arhodomonas aquaeolei]MCS4503043.1 lipid IV(A) 3-deoxy-D-manno-octulosonic acid transferase [Arhodomonas aquaeolei]
MPRTLYTLALRLATPAILVRLLWRSRRAPAYRRRWGERFGFGPAIDGAPVWVHAVSVGETVAARGLIEALMAAHPERPVLVTSTTPTGSERVRALFGDRVRHCYLPYDTPGAVRRFLARTRPALGVLMETEIWPNLIAEADARGIPLVLANARLSARSAAGYARTGRLGTEAVRGLAAIAAQHDADAERFRALGASPGRLHVTGSLKFDQPVDETQRQAGEALRGLLGPARAVWIAASTHEGEESAALAAHRRVLEAVPGAVLVLVPRHPERFDGVAALTRSEGFRFARRSTPGTTDAANVDVLVGDTMGELPTLLAAGDIAFMGGSLVAVGGHNPLEPAALGHPVITGPYVHNFARIFELLTEAGGARTVTDADGLATAVIEWLTDSGARIRAGQAAEGVVAAHRGALGRTVALIEALTPRSSPRE